MAAADQATSMNVKLRRFILLVDLKHRSLTPYALRPLLRQFGYNVCPAATEREAMEYIRVVVPSLIVIDAMQASDDVYEMIERLKKERGCARIPVVLTAEPAAKEHEAFTRRRLLAAFIRKPVNTDDLYQAVQRALERVPRQNIRVTTCLKAIQGDIEGAEGYATELSERGMFFRTTFTQPVDVRLPVWIWTGDRQIQLEAKVIYQSRYGAGTFRGPGMGMMFVNIKPEDQTYLRSFIQRQLQAGMCEGGQ
jgi:CheY-like chemotaxis protein